MSAASWYALIAATLLLAAVVALRVGFSYPIFWRWLPNILGMVAGSMIASSIIAAGWV